MEFGCSSAIDKLSVHSITVCHFCFLYGFWIDSIIISDVLSNKVPNWNYVQEMRLNTINRVENRIELKTITALKKNFDCVHCAHACTETEKWHTQAAKSNVLKNWSTSALSPTMASVATNEIIL